MHSTAQANQLQELLGLKAPPAAVAFRPSAPPEVPRIDAVAPSGCTYWKLAAEGKTFYTTASDHYQCPIGAHTHGIDLPPAQAAELQGLVETMVTLEYIRMEEVPSIPRLDGAFGVAIYGPLDRMPIPPDVVLVRGNARQIMLVTEACRAAGIGPEGGMMGRPTCAMLPVAMQGGRGAASLGCIGNRVYTELADDELYCAIPGPQVAAVIEKLATIVRANDELERFHRARTPTT
jgi:uncharacterized protein (DUF169 family)